LKINFQLQNPTPDQLRNRLRAANELPPEEIDTDYSAFVSSAGGAPPNVSPRRKPGETHQRRKVFPERCRRVPEKSSPRQRWELSPHPPIFCCAIGAALNSSVRARPIQPSSITAKLKNQCE
jgi:hypothetical protein